MEAMHKLRVHVWWVLLVMLVAGLVILDGCKDEAAEMAKQQISSRPANRERQKRNTQDADSGTETADPAAETGAEGTGEEPAAEAEYTGPKVDVTILECKPPYPEFAGKGRYTIKIEVSSQEYLERCVWDILFFDTEGKEVAKDRQELKIPMGDHPMVLKFSSLFCMAKPETIELRQTDLKATQATEGEAGAGGAEAAPPAGGGGSGDVGGRSGPSTGGGGSSSGGGGSSSGGGEGGENNEDVGLDD